MRKLVANKGDIANSSALDKDGVFNAPWENSFNKVITPFEEFLHRQTTSGVLLILTAIAALVFVNVGFEDVYNHIRHIHFSVGLGDFSIDKTLHHWINDGLMALFFFVVGLELKREIVAGELSDLRKATLPIAAALGGMILPALIYFWVNSEGMAAGGWGIPMATDIAFALGVLALLSRRVPKALITFLVALAIVDDLGAVMVIAFFYTDTIAMDALMLAAILFALLAAFNFAGIRKVLPYLIVSVFLWYALLQSGVHATLAGVLGALTVPTTPKYDPKRFSRRVKDLMGKFDIAHKHDENIMTNEDLRAIVQSLEGGAHNVQTMSQRLEHLWHMPVAYIIIPIFVLFNAGIPIEFASLGDVLSHPVALGISLGLIIGKFVGITGVSWVFLKFGFASLPRGVSFSQIAGVSLLAGIGFTMSIFVAELAFENHEELLLISKTGIIFASLLAGAVGSVWLFIAGKKS